MMNNKKIEFYNIEQNTTEWFKLKNGLASSSNFGLIMANYPKAFGNPGHEYAMRIALERTTGAILDSFVNEYMEHGIEYEPIAREKYEEHNFASVDNGGFFISNGVGSSPDGLIGEDGLIEIKCPKWSTHFKTIKRGAMDPKYNWQVQGQLFVTGRKWCDWISYNDEFTEDYQLLTHRIKPDPESFEKIAVRLAMFEKLINEYVEMIS
jgi:hypothetical protein